MPNGTQKLIGSSEILYRVISEADRRFPAWADTQVSMNLDQPVNLDHQELVKFVLDHEDHKKLKALLQEQIKGLEKKFHVLGLGEDKIREILFGDPKQQSNMLNVAGGKLKAEAAAKLKEGKKDEAKALGEKAKYYFKLALQVDPANGSAHRNMADIRFAEGRKDEAYQHLHFAIRWESGSDKFLQLAGQLIKHEGMSPTKAYRWVGAELLKHRSKVEAMDYFREASKLVEKQDPHLAKNLGEKADLIDEKINQYDLKAAEQRPEFKKMIVELRSRGVPLAALDEKKEGKQRIVTERSLVIALVDNWKDPRFQAAALDSGVMPKAWFHDGKLRDKYVKLFGEKYGLAKILGAHHAELAGKVKDPAQIESHWRLAHIYRPSDVSYLTAIGKFYTGRKDFESAKNAFEAAYKKDSDNPTLKAQLLESALAAGDLSLAFRKNRDYTAAQVEEIMDGQIARVRALLKGGDVKEAKRLVAEINEGWKKGKRLADVKKNLSFGAERRIEFDIDLLESELKKAQNKVPDGLDHQIGRLTRNMNQYPDQLGLQVLRARAYASMGDARAAYRDYKEAHDKFKAQNAPFKEGNLTHEIRTFLDEKAGRLETVRRDLKAAEKGNPQDWKLIEKLASEERRLTEFFRDAAKEAKVYGRYYPEKPADKIVQELGNWEVELKASAKTYHWARIQNERASGDYKAAVMDFGALIENTSDPVERHKFILEFKLYHEDLLYLYQETVENLNIAMKAQSIDGVPTIDVDLTSGLAKKHVALLEALREIAGGGKKSEPLYDPDPKIQHKQRLDEFTAYSKALEEAQTLSTIYDQGKAENSIIVQLDGMAAQGHMGELAKFPDLKPYVSLGTVDGQTKLQFTEAYLNLPYDKKLDALKALTAVGQLGQMKALSAKPETPALQKQYFAWKIALAEGRVEDAKVKMIDFKASVNAEIKKDSGFLENNPEIASFYNECREQQRTMTMAFFDKIEGDNQMLKQQRLAKLGMSTYEEQDARLNGDFVKFLKYFVEEGKADTPEEALAFMQAEDKRLDAEYLANPVIEKNWAMPVPFRAPRYGDERSASVTLANGFYDAWKKDPNAEVPAGMPSMKLAGGMVSTAGGADAYMVRLVIGKEGGSVQCYSDTYVYPPSTEDRVVIFFPQQGRVENPPGVTSNRVRTSGYGAFNMRNPDFIQAYRQGHPWALDDYVGTYGQWTNIRIRDSDFQSLFQMETRAELEKMADPQGRRTHLLAKAESLRHRHGSYELSGEILIELMQEPLKKAIAEIPDSEKKTMWEDLEKERPQVKEEILKQLEKFKKDKPSTYNTRFPKGEPTSDEIDAMVTESLKGKLAVKLMKKALPKIDSWADNYDKENNPLSNDPIARKAWSIYEDMKDPLDRTWNLSDDSWDSIIDEVVITVVTLPITMGVGSAIRAGVGGTMLIRGLAARGGIRWLAAETIVLASGAAGESLAMGAMHGNLSFESFSINMLMTGAFHIGGKSWGKLANKLMIGEDAMKLAIREGRGVVGLRVANFTGMMTTQTGLAVAFDYAQEFATGKGSGLKFSDRLMSHGARQVGFHYGSQAFRKVSGNVFMEAEQRADMARRIAGREYERLVQSGMKPDKAYTEALALSQKLAPSMWKGAKAGEIEQRYNIRSTREEVAKLIERMGVDPLSTEGKLLTRVFRLAAGQGDKMADVAKRIAESKPGNMDELVRKALLIDPATETGKHVKAILAMTLVKQLKNPAFAKEFPELYQIAAQMREPIKEWLKSTGADPKSKDFQNAESALLEAALAVGLDPAKVGQLAGQTPAKETIDVILGKGQAETPTGKRLAMTLLIWSVRHAESPDALAKSLKDWPDFAAKIEPALKKAADEYLKGDSASDYGSIFRSLVLQRALAKGGTAAEALKEIETFQQGSAKNEADLRKAVGEILGMGGDAAMKSPVGHQAANEIILAALARAGTLESFGDALHQLALTANDFHPLLKKALEGMVGSADPFLMGRLFANVYRSTGNLSDIHKALESFETAAPDLKKHLDKAAADWTGIHPDIKAELLRVVLQNAENPAFAKAQLIAFAKKGPELKTALTKGVDKALGTKRGAGIATPDGLRLAEMLLGKALWGSRTLNDVPARLKAAVDDALKTDGSRNKSISEPEVDKALSVLGLTRDQLNEGTVKKRQRELSRTLHPDFHTDKPADEQKKVGDRFGEMQAAYELLISYLKKPPVDATKPNAKPTAAPTADSQAKPGTPKVGGPSQKRLPGRVDDTDVDGARAKTDEDLAYDAAARGKSQAARVTPSSDQQTQAAKPGATNRTPAPVEGGSAGSRGNELVQRYDPSETKDTGNWSQERRVLEVFADKAYENTPLGEKAGRARAALDKITELQAQATQLQRQKEGIEAGSAKEKNWEKLWKANQNWLEGQIKIVGAWETALESAKAVRDVALIGQIHLQNQVAHPLESTHGSPAKGAEPLAALRAKVSSVQEQHPDEVARFAEYAEGEIRKAGGLTIVVKDAADIPAVANAVVQSLESGATAAGHEAIRFASWDAVQASLRRANDKLKLEGHAYEVDASGVEARFEKAAADILGRLPANASDADRKAAAAAIVAKSLEGTSVKADPELTEKSLAKALPIRMNPAKGNLSPDAEGKSVVVLEGKGPKGETIHYEVTIRPQTQAEKDTAANPKQAPAEAPAVSRSYDAISWRDHPDTGAPSGSIAGIPGIEFTTREGELWARATEGSRTVLLNGKEKIELGPTFIAVGSEEKDTLTIDGKSFQISGHESRLIPVETPSKKTGAKPPPAVEDAKPRINFGEGEKTAELGKPKAPTLEFYGTQVREGAGALVAEPGHFGNRAERVEILNFDVSGKAPIDIGGVKGSLSLDRYGALYELAVETLPAGSLVFSGRPGAWKRIEAGSRVILQGDDQISVQQSNGQIQIFKTFNPQQVNDRAMITMRGRANKLEGSISSFAKTGGYPELVELRGKAVTLYEEAIDLENRRRPGGITLLQPSLNRSAVEIANDIRELENKFHGIIIDRFQKSVDASKANLRDLVTATKDPELLKNYEKFLTGLSQGIHDIDHLYAARLQYIEFFKKSMESQASAELVKLGDGKDVPRGLSFEFENLIKTQMDMGLLAGGVDTATLQSFVSELTRFHHDYPPPANVGYFQLQDVVMTRHFLLGEKPTTKAYIETIIENLKGYRSVFKGQAGAIFHGEGRIVQELSVPDPAHPGRKKPTGLFLVIERGRHEYQNGLEMAIYAGEPKSDPNPMKPRQEPIYKIGLHFGKDQSLRIVNIQGASAFESGKAGHENSVQRISAALGGGNPFDMMMGAVIFWGRENGFAKVEGIADSAQNARGDEVTRLAGGKGKGFYDLFFKRMGFEKPAAGSDYWSLDLKTMNIRRKKTPAPSPQAQGPGGQRYAVTEGENTPGQYFRQILIRDSEARPDKWDKQTPRPLADPVVAFWKVMVPALSTAKLQPYHSYGDRKPLDTSLQPLKILPGKIAEADMLEVQAIPAPPKPIVGPPGSSEVVLSFEEFLKYADSPHFSQVKEQRDLYLRQRYDDALALVGEAEKAGLPADKTGDLFFALERQLLDDVRRTENSDFVGSRDAFLGQRVQAAREAAAALGLADKPEFTRALALFVVENIRGVESDYAIALKDGDLIAALETSTVPESVYVTKPEDIVHPVQNSQIVEVAYNLDDPKLYKEVQAGEVPELPRNAYHLEPPPPVKSLQDLASAYRIPTDASYNAVLAKAAGRPDFQLKAVADTMAILKPALDAMNPFTRDLATRQLFQWVAEGRIPQEGAAKLTARVLSGEGRFLLGTGGLQYQKLETAEHRRDAYREAQVNLAFRGAGTSLFNAGAQAYTTLLQGLEKGTVSLQDIQMIAGAELNGDTIGRLEKLWGPRSQWLMNFAKKVETGDRLALKRYLNHISISQEIVYLSGTNTPFAEPAVRALNDLQGLNPGSPEAQKAVDVFQKERDRFSESLVANYDAPRKNVETYLKGNLKSANVIRVESRRKNPSDVGAKLMRRGFQTLEAITDLAGVRVIVKGPEDAMRVVSALREKYPVRETYNGEGEIQLHVTHTEKGPGGEEILVLDSVNDLDSVTRLLEGGKSGYRAVHVTVEENGKAVEIQIVTEEMEIWGKNQHKLYKADGTFDPLAKVETDLYFKKAADYISAVERGLETPKLPVLPDTKLLPASFADAVKKENLHLKTLESKKSALAAAKGKAQARLDRPGPGANPPAPGMSEGLQRMYGAAKDFFGRIRFRMGLGAVIGGEFYLAPKEPAPGPVVKVGQIFGMDGRIALENSVPAGKTFVQLNLTGNFDSVLGQIQNTHTASGDHPEYLILHVDGENGHRFVVVDTFQNLSNSGQLLSLYTGTTPNNKFYLGYRVEKGRDGGTVIHLDQISHSFGPGGEEHAYNAVDGFFRRMSVLYPHAKIVARPTDRFVVNELGQTLKPENVALPKGDKLLDALREWDVISGDQRQELAELRAGGKDSALKRKLFEYLGAAMAKEHAAGREKRSHNELEYLWNLLSDAKRDFAASPNPALRAHSELFDAFFSPDLALEGRLRPGHIQDITSVLTRVSIRTRIAVNEIHTINHDRRGNAIFGPLEGLRSEPDTLADAQKVLDGLHDEVAGSRIDPLVLGADGKSAQSAIHYEVDGQSVSHPIHFKFAAKQQAVAPADPWENNPYLDFQVSKPAPPVDPVAERRLRYAQGLVSWFLHEARPEMAQMAMDYVQALESAVQKGGVLPAAPFADGFAYQANVLGAGRKRTGAAGFLIFDSGQGPGPGLQPYSLLSVEKSEVLLVAPDGKKLRVQVDTKAGGQLLGQLKPGDQFFYQETIGPMAEEKLSAAARGKVSARMDPPPPVAPSAPKTLPAFDASTLNKRQKGDVDAWLAGRELGSLSPADQGSLVKHLLNAKKWKKQELQNFISPEGMKEFLGYGKDLPFGFDSVKQWNHFQKQLMQELLAAGVPIHDPRVKVVLTGSSVRGRSHSIEGSKKPIFNHPYKWNPDLKSPNKALRVMSDIDVAITVDGELFQTFLDRRTKAREAQGLPTGAADKDLSRIVYEEKFSYTHFDPSLTKARTNLQKTMSRPIHMAIIPPGSDYLPDPQVSMVISPDLAPAPKAPANLPDVLDRIGNPLALQSGEGAGLLKVIQESKQPPAAKLEALVLLAGRKDFSDHPAAVKAVMAAGGDLLETEGALTRISSLAQGTAADAAKPGNPSGKTMAGGAAMALNPVAVQWAADLIHQSGPVGWFVAGAAMLAGGAYLLRRFFGGKAEAEGAVPPLDPNVRAVMVMDAQEFGAQPSLVGQIPGLTADMENRFLAGEWIEPAGNGRYAWTHYRDGGPTRVAGNATDEAAYRISASWRDRMGFPAAPRLEGSDEASGKKYLKTVEQREQSSAVSNRRLKNFSEARGLVIRGNLPGPQADYVLSILEKLPPSLLDNPRYLRGLTLGADNPGSLDGGHYRDGVAAIYHGTAEGPRRNLLGFVLKEIGNSSAARYALDADENRFTAGPGASPLQPDANIPQNVREAIHQDYAAVAAPGKNQAFALHWAGGANARKAYTSANFSEFLSEFHVHYVAAGTELRAHIDGLIANPQTRSQGEAYERIYQEMRWRVFGGTEFAGGDRLAGPAPRAAVQAAPTAPSAPQTAPDSIATPLATDGEYILGGGRKGSEGENYRAVPDQVVSQRHAKVVKEGNVLTLQSISADSGKKVWVQEGDRWAELSPRSEYPLERGQRFALGDLTFDRAGRAGFERAVVLSIGADGSLRPETPLMQRPEAPQRLQTDLAADGDIRALQIGPDGRPVATETIAFDRPLLPGTYRLARSENPTIPVGPMFNAAEGVFRVQILTGDAEKPGTDPQYLDAPQLILKDFANNGTPKRWGEMEIQGERGQIHLDPKLKGSITVTRNGAIETYKAGSTFEIGSGDIIQIGATDYTVDLTSGTLKPYAESHAGLIKAELRIPEPEAAAAAARAAHSARLKDPAAARDARKGNLKGEPAPGVVVKEFQTVTDGNTWLAEQAVHSAVIGTASGDREVQLRLDPSLSRYFDDSPVVNLWNAYSHISVDRAYRLPDGRTLQFTGDVLGQGSTTTIFLAEVASPGGPPRKMAVKVRTHGIDTKLQFQAEFDPAMAQTMRTATESDVRIAAALSAIDPDYVGAAPVALNQTEMAYLGPYYDPATSVIFDSLARLNESQKAIVRPQMEKLFVELADRGHRLGDVEFVLSQDGKLHLIDIEGVRLNAFDPKDAAARDAALKDMRENHLPPARIMTGDAGNVGTDSGYRPAPPGIRVPPQAVRHDNAGGFEQNLQTAMVSLEEKKQNLFQLLETIEIPAGHSRQATVDTLYRVLERNAPLEALSNEIRLTSDQGLRDAAYEYMALTISLASRHVPSEFEAAKNARENPFNGESLLDGRTYMTKTDAEFRMARMLLRNQSGLSLNAEPSPMEKEKVTAFLTRAMGISEVRDFASAKARLKEEVLKLSENFKKSWSGANAELRALLLDVLFEDNFRIPMKDLDSALKILSFLGRNGLYRELGAAIDPKNPSRVILAYGDYFSVVLAEEGWMFVLHNHPERYLNKKGEVQGVDVTFRPDMALVSRSTAAVLASREDVRWAVQSAQALFAGNFPASTLWNPKDRIFSSWVQHPYGLSNFRVELDKKGEIKNIEVKYALYAKDGLDNLHVAKALDLQQAIAADIKRLNLEKNPKISVSQVKLESLEKSRPWKEDPDPVQSQAGGRRPLNPSPSNQKAALGVTKPAYRIATDDFGGPYRGGNREPLFPGIPEKHEILSVSDLGYATYFRLKHDETIANRTLPKGSFVTLFPEERSLSILLSAPLVVSGISFPENTHLKFTAKGTFLYATLPEASSWEASGKGLLGFLHAKFHEMSTGVLDNFVEVQGMLVFKGSTIWFRENGTVKMIRLAQGQKIKGVQFKRDDLVFLDSAGKIIAAPQD